ncbi:MAG: hypothetical protein KKD63_14360 [Proteobacteria bacterium]|nr:hypothetical protein [Desulfobulbaceae bacterium]MBU4154052.1 hypothetical protein [Pseudomonadota bacterium]
MKKIKLAGRDRKILIAVLLGGALLLILSGGVIPFLESKERLRRGVAAKETAIPQMLQLEAQYQTANHAVSNVEQRLALQPKGFALFPFLEEKSGEAGVADKIKYMKPMTSAIAGSEFSESLVEMKLEGISLEQMLGYLAKIEVPEQLVGIKRISIQQDGKAEPLLDVVVQVVSVSK